MIRRLAIVVALLGVLAPASAEPSFVGFTGAAFIFGPESQSSVPDVIGQANAAAADAILEGAGFDMGGVTARCSDAALDEVIGQSPAPGEQAEAGALVDLLVSNGVGCVVSGRSGVRLKGLRMKGI